MTEPTGPKLGRPFEGDYAISDDYAAHDQRGSNAPGVDYKLPRGTQVLAAADGLVTWCQWGDAGGRYLMIDHGDRFTSLYSHLQAVWVVRGEKVKAGQTIALSGSTGGASTGPHLHFGVAVREKGKLRWVDPLPLLKDGAGG